MEPDRRGPGDLQRCKDLASVACVLVRRRIAKTLQMEKEVGHLTRQNRPKATLKNYRSDLAAEV